MSADKAGRRSSAGSAAESASRRVEERETLHNLNSRLSYFLSRMKEVELRNSELQQRVDADAASARSQSEAARAAFERELTELRAAEAEGAARIAELEARCASTAAQLADALQSEASRAAALSEQTAGLLERKLAPLREQLAAAEALRRSEGAALREQLDEAAAAGRAELAAARAAHEGALQEALARAREGADRTRADELQQLAAHFHAVEAELAREVAERGAAADAAGARAAELEAERAPVRARLEAAETRAAELERMAGALRAELDEAREALRLMEAEHEALLGAKVSLDEELAAYSGLLEGEEARLGITPEPPRAKRRQPADGPAAPYVSELDLANECVRVANAGGEPCALGGHRLQSVHSDDLAFEFPAGFELAAGASVAVFSGKRNQRKRRDPSKELFWSARYMWSDEGDCAVLRDPSNAELSRLEAAAHSVARAPDPTTADGDDDEDEARAGGERQCAVM